MCAVLYSSMLRCAVDLGFGLGKSFPLDAGAKRVVIATAAVKNPNELHGVVYRHARRNDVAQRTVFAASDALP